MLIGISGYIGSGKSATAMMVQALTMPQKGRWYHDPIEYLKGYEGRPNLKGGWEIKAFAGKLKQIVSLLTGIPVEDLEKPEVKDSQLGPEWDLFPYMGDLVPESYMKEDLYQSTGEHPTQQWIENLRQRMTVRSLLQKLGTDAMRDKVHPNIHVNALFADYRGVYKGLPSEYNWDGNNHLEYPNWVISDLRFPNEAQAIKDRGGICIRINRVFEPTLGEPDGRRAALHSSETSLDKYEFDYVIDNSGTLEDLLEQVRTMLLHFKIIEP